MRWKVLIIFAVSAALVNGKKRRAGGRSLEKTSRDLSPNAGVRPSDKQGSRYVPTFSSPYRKLYQPIPYKALTGVRSGLQSATVDGSVIAESTGEGGYFVGPSASKSKGIEGTQLQMRRPEIKKAVTGFSKEGHRPYYSPQQNTNPHHLGPGIFLPKVQTRPSSPQSVGLFTPKFFQDITHHLFGPNIFHEGDFGQGFFRFPSFLSQFPFMAPHPQGLFKPPGFQFLGNAGVNEYRSDGTNFPPTPDPRSGMYGPGVGYWPANNGIGTYGNSAAMYGTRPYGAQPGGYTYGNPARSFAGSARGLDSYRRNDESSRRQLLGPNTSFQTSSASSRDREIDGVLLSQLLSIKGEHKLFKSIRDITWSTVKANTTGFTTIAEFTSVLPTEAFQCTAIITGSKVSGVMRLNGNDSDLDCIPLKLATEPSQAASSGNPKSRIPDASRAAIPVHPKGNKETTRERENVRLYANKDDQPINPEPNGYASYQYIDNPHGLL